jgi:hypothetical protein
MTSDTKALNLDQFWRWVTVHYNCIIRAGNDSCLLFDLPDLHWHLTREDGLLYVQLIRAKDLIAELAIDPTVVLYVEATPQQEEEQVIFDLVADVDGEPMSVFHFLMAHGYDEAADAQRRSWTH